LSQPPQRVPIKQAEVNVGPADDVLFGSVRKLAITTPGKKAMYAVLLFVATWPVAIGQVFRSRIRVPF
jgi:hypothetical protein